MLLEGLRDGLPDRRLEAVRQVLAQHSFHERARLWLRFRAPLGAVRSRHRPEMEQMADAERRVVRRVVVGVGDEALLGDQERIALRIALGRDAPGEASSLLSALRVLE